MHDNVGDTAIATANVAQPAKLIVSHSISNNICYGATNGTATVIVTGGTLGYDYYWSTGSAPFTATLANLASGIYTVTVKDGHNCAASDSIFIDGPPPISISVTAVSSSCGIANGSATASATGLAGGFSYAWNTLPTQSTPQADGLAAGIYTVTATHINGCAATATVSVGDAGDINAHFDTINSTCGLPNGSIAVIGVLPYTYTWSTSPIQTTDSALALPPARTT